MAQSIILKRSALQGKVPTTSSLNVGELAINTYDGKIYLNRSGSSQSIQEVVTTNAVNTGSITLTQTGSFGELVVSQDGNFQRDLYVTRDVISNGNLDVLYDVTASAFLGVIRATNGVISSSAQLTLLNAFTASAGIRLTNLETTTSSLNSSVSQINLVTASLNSKTASYATTGSNTFRGNQIVSGSITTSGSVSIVASGSNVFTVDGTSGRLFSIDDSLSGSLFSVNTAAGLPVMEAFSDNTIRIGQFGQRALFVSQSRVGIGKELGLNATLDVSGSAIFSGSLSVSGQFTASLQSGYIWVGDSNGLNRLVPTSSFAITTSGSASFVVSAISSSYPFRATASGNVSIYSSDAGQGTNNDFSYFIGYKAGLSASNSTYSTYIGDFAGAIDNGSSTYSHAGVMIGSDAGYNANNSFLGVYIGNRAGMNATNASQSVFIGTQAGESGSQAANSVMVGNQAGYFASQSVNAIFIGAGSGVRAAGAYETVAIGLSSAGAISTTYASNAFRSVFIGSAAGSAATNASNTVAIGYGSGQLATNASSSVFIGNQAGVSNSNASFSNFIGYKAGSNGGSLLGANNTIIGTNITLPAGYSNYANIGAVLFISGTYSTTTGNPTQAASNGRVGINVINPTLGMLQVGGNVYADAFTGSLFGTASWANNVVSASFASTSSFTLRGLVTASVAGATITFTKGDNTTFDLTIAQSGTVATASYVTSSGVFGPFGSNSILSASYATTASYVQTALSSSYPLIATATALQFASSLQVQSLLLGVDAGYLAPSAASSTFIGYQAGYLANAAQRSNFIGYQSGYSASNAELSNFIGNLAGSGSTNANNVNFIGNQAGASATDASYSNFIGWQAGVRAPNATDANFIGYRAGFGATNAQQSNFIGNQAGMSASSADVSNFIGDGAGLRATNAYNSNFIGDGAGYRAVDAIQSNFIGTTAGYDTPSASYSNLIGYRAGRNYYYASGARGIKSNNTIIGTNITLPDGTQDSINIGGLIFATGSYSDVVSDPFSGSANGRVGINQPNPQFNFDVSGSGRYTNGLTVSNSLILSGSSSTTLLSTNADTILITGSAIITGSVVVTGSVNATNFTGSLFGTASWATNANNASNISINVFGSDVESYLLMSNVVATTGVAVGGDADLRYNTVTNKLTVGSVSATSLTGSLQGTARWAINALTASNVSTASLVNNFFVQGGNSFGTTALIGTNDSQSLAFETSGSVRMFISGGGNIGVGTITPSASLHILGTNTADTYSLWVQNSSGETLISAQNNRTININSTNATNGDTNIGTTNGIINFNRGYNNTLIGNALNFYSGGPASTIQGFNTSPGIAIGYAGTTVNPNPGTGLSVRGTTTTSGSAVLFVTGSSTTRLLALASETNPNAFVVSGSGNVGIGTNTPNALLHLTSSTSNNLFEIDTPTQNNILLVSSSGVVSIGMAGAAYGSTGTNNGKLTINNTSGNNGLAIRNGETGYQLAIKTTTNDGIGTEFVWYDGSTTTFLQYAGNIGTRLGSATVSQFRSNTDSSSTIHTGASTLERFRVTSTGLVGIGTATPNALLHVSGSTILGATYGNTHTITGSVSINESGSNIPLTVNGRNLISSTNNKVLEVLGSGGTSVFSARSNGLVYVGTGQLYFEQNGLTARYYDSRLQFGNTSITTASANANPELYGGIKIFSWDGSTASPEVFRVQGDGRVGIGTTTPNARLDVSGSAIISGSLIVTQGITGSLSGTASWALNAATASSAPNIYTSDGTLTGNRTISTTSGYTLTINPITTFSGSTSAVSGIGRGTIFTPTILPTANNDTVVGMDIYPSFGTFSYPNNFNSFTSFPIGVRISGNCPTNFNALDLVNYAGNSGETIALNFYDNGAKNRFGGLRYMLNDGGNLSSLQTFIHGQKVSEYYSTGNLVIQTGGAFVDNGYKLDVSGSTRINGNLIVSGSLTVTQGITGSLFGTASWATNALTTSYANSGFRIANTEFHNTSSLTTSGTTTISQLATGSYISAFYNYSIISASNARAGQIMSIWSGSTATYTEVTTTDIGNTSVASFSVNVVGSNVQLNFTAPGTWTVRTIANLL